MEEIHESHDIVKPDEYPEGVCSYCIWCVCHKMDRLKQPCEIPVWMKPAPQSRR